MADDMILAPYANQATSSIPPFQFHFHDTPYLPLRYVVMIQDEHSK